MDPERQRRVPEEQQRELRTLQKLEQRVQIEETGGLGDAVAVTGELFTSQQLARGVGREDALIREQECEVFP